MEVILENVIMNNNIIKKIKLVGGIEDIYNVIQIIGAESNIKIPENTYHKRYILDVIYNACSKSNCKALSEFLNTACSVNENNDMIINGEIYHRGFGKDVFERMLFPKLMYRYFNSLIEDLYVLK